MLVILVLGAASGFPNQITESTLWAWLKDFGVSNTTIGIFSYVAIPYLLKPLWAPLLDRYAVADPRPPARLDPGDAARDRGRRSFVLAHAGSRRRR